MNSPSLEVFKGRLEGAQEEGWSKMSFKVSPTPSIPLFYDSM